MAVYMIRAGKTGPVKIGKAKNPPRRMATFQTAHYEHLKLVRTVSGYTVEEAWLRKHYGHLHIRGEWHHWCDSMMHVVVPDLLPTPRVAQNLKPYVTRVLTERDFLIALPEPFGLRGGPSDERQRLGLIWAEALHEWMTEHQHTPQTLCGGLGVVPSTVCGWVGYGCSPQKIPGQRLIVESCNALFGSLEQLRPGFFKQATAA